MNQIPDEALFVCCWYCTHDQRKMKLMAFFRLQFCTLRLQWAGDNMGKWDESLYESCTCCRIDHSTNWPAVQHSTTMLRKPRLHLVIIYSYFDYISVQTVPSCENVSLAPLDGDYGYVSSLFWRRTGEGTRQCPWSISAQKGQHIDLYLYDFLLNDFIVQNHGKSVCENIGMNEWCLRP